MSQFIEMFGSVDDNPKSYDIKKVGDFAECFAGATPSTKISSYWDNGNIPWMSSGEVHKARVQDTDAKITQQGYDGCSTKMVPIHSIVIALAGQGKTRGTVAINDIELCTNQSLCAIVPNEEVNYEYLFHNLRGRYKELRSMSGDVDGRGGLNLKHIQSIKVIVPPMSEQMKFVSIARQADKSGFDGRKSQFIEMFGNQDVNDRSWNESIVKDEFTLTMGKTPARNNPAFWQSGTNKWISISDMARYGRYTEDTQESITDIAVAESGIKIVPKGTIIMSFKLSIGRTAVTSEDIYTNEAIMAFRDVDGTKFNMTFLQFLIANKNWLLNAKQAVKGQTLNKESIGNARIIVPPIGLQEQFAAIYNQADKSGSGGRESVALMGKVKKSLINYYNI